MSIVEDNSIQPDWGPDTPDPAIVPLFLKFRGDVEEDAQALADQRNSNRRRIPPLLGRQSQSKYNERCDWEAEEVKHAAERIYGLMIKKALGVERLEDALWVNQKRLLAIANGRTVIEFDYDRPSFNEQWYVDGVCILDGLHFRVLACFQAHNLLISRARSLLTGSV